MATIFAANESTVTLDGAPIEGVVALEYHRRSARANVYALGSTERIGMVSGPADVDGRLTVASTASNLDAITAEQSFTLVANLKRGDTALSVTLAECFLTGKDFSLAAGEHGTATYSFTAIRVEEAPPS